MMPVKYSFSFSDFRGFYIALHRKKKADYEECNDMDANGNLFPVPADNPLCHGAEGLSGL